MRRRAPLLAAWVFWVALSLPLAAQDFGRVQSPILTIESDRFFFDSAFGRAVVAELDERRSALAAENRRIEAELGAEEKELTLRRPDMPAPEFRELADAFDKKVQGIRRAQEEKARILERLVDERRRAFLGAAQPVLEDIMRQAGAAVVVERRNVFISADVIDVTDLAVQLMDAADSPAPERLPDQGGDTGSDDGGDEDGAGESPGKAAPQE